MAKNAQPSYIVLSPSPWTSCNLLNEAKKLPMSLIYADVNKSCMKPPSINSEPRPPPWKPSKAHEKKNSHALITPLMAVTYIFWHCKWIAIHTCTHVLDEVGKTAVRLKDSSNTKPFSPNKPFSPIFFSQHLRKLRSKHAAPGKVRR